MAKKKVPGQLKPHKQEESYFYMRWPVIVAALLLIWPMGMILLITKIIGIVKKSREEKILVDPTVPFAKFKTPAEKQRYGEAQRRQKKRIFTTSIMAALFLSLGCASITGDYLQLFSLGFSTALLTDFISHAAFLLVGVYMVFGTYSNLQQQSRITRIRHLIGNQPQVALQQLALESGINEETLRSDLSTMLDRSFFGHGAFYDEVQRVLFCYEP